jgi:Methyltransferase domain
VLEHIVDPSAALREMYRICSKNIIISVPNCRISEGMRKSNLLYSHWSDPTHVNFFYPETICNLIESSGFKVIHTEGINRLTPFPFLLELLGIPDQMHDPVRGILKRLVRRSHFITTLVVADKVIS